MRIANESGEHFFAGYQQTTSYGLPVQPRVHLSISPGGQQVMWQRGNLMELFRHLLDWTTLRLYRVQLEASRLVDEQGDRPHYKVTLFTVSAVAEAEAGDPLSTLLRALVLADRVPEPASDSDETRPYGMWSGHKLE